MELIIGFLVLMALVSGTIIFFLHRTLISSTEGAVKRLNDEVAKASEKQAELSKKIKEADEELVKRRAEATALADKMRSGAEEESKAERDKIITKARSEGEDIIIKAQNAKIKIRQELEKEIDSRALGYSMRVLNSILSERAMGSFNDVIVNGFLENLNDVDMSKIDPDIKIVDVITVNPLSQSVESQLLNVLKKKLDRAVSINGMTDVKIGGGVILKFGTLALDGSISNLIREATIAIQQEIEDKVDK